MVGTRGSKTGNAYAVHTKEQWYAAYHIQSVTPFPDQDAICHDIARARFRSKLDMTEAYEQTCIRPEDVCKTTFPTIFGTFQSQVM